MPSYAAGVARWALLVPLLGCCVSAWRTMEKVGDFVVGGRDADIKDYSWLAAVVKPFPVHDVRAVHTPPRA